MQSTIIPINHRCTALMTYPFRDISGNTALHLAVTEANVSIVRALIAFDCDSMAKNEQGKSAWQLAEELMDKSGMMDFKDREGVLYSLFAAGVSGCSSPMDKSGHERDFKKMKALCSPSHKRVRSLFDEVLSQRAQSVCIVVTV